MKGQWRVAKVLDKDGYHIEFQRFYISEQRISDKNRIVVSKNNRPYMTMNVHDHFGNYYYKMLKENNSDWRFILDACYLDMCAFYDDYDTYSDVYKDISGGRPHYTQDQWDEHVRFARKLGY